MKKVASLAGKNCRLVVRSVAQPAGNNKSVEVENNKKVENNRQRQNKCMSERTNI